jgi:hypothetical protein
MVSSQDGSNGADTPRKHTKRSMTTDTTYQARLNKAKPGDLQSKLDAQKRQTHNQTLQQAANENRLAREADQATETRNYN